MLTLCWRTWTLSCPMLTLCWPKLPLCCPMLTLCSPTLAVEMLSPIAVTETAEVGTGWERGGDGVRTTRSAVGGARLYNLRLPPKASGKDTDLGRCPAPGFKGYRPCRRPLESLNNRLSDGLRRCWHHGISAQCSECQRSQAWTSLDKGKNEARRQRIRNRCRKGTFETL